MVKFEIMEREEFEKTAQCLWIRYSHYVLRLVVVMKCVCVIVTLAGLCMCELIQHSNGDYTILNDSLWYFVILLNNLSWFSSEVMWKTVKRQSTVLFLNKENKAYLKRNMTFSKIFLAQVFMTGNSTHI